jgi:hypothetical protein
LVVGDGDVGGVMAVAANICAAGFILGKEASSGGFLDFTLPPYNKRGRIRTLFKLITVNV